MSRMIQTCAFRTASVHPYGSFSFISEHEVCAHRTLQNDQRQQWKGLPATCANTLITCITISLLHRSCASSAVHKATVIFWVAKTCRIGLATCEKTKIRSFVIIKKRARAGNIVIFLHHCFYLVFSWTVGGQMKLRYSGGAIQMFYILQWNLFGLIFLYRNSLCIISFPSAAYLHCRCSRLPHLHVSLFTVFSFPLHSQGFR